MIQHGGAAVPNSQRDRPALLIGLHHGVCMERRDVQPGNALKTFMSIERRDLVHGLDRGITALKRSGRVSTGASNSAKPAPGSVIGVVCVTTAILVIISLKRVANSARSKRPRSKM